MKSLLGRLKLIDHITTELPIEKRDFVSKLKSSVDQGNTGLLFSAFEAFSSSKNEYKGMVTHDSFKIRRRRRLFDMSIGLAVAEGSFRQKDNLLVIDSTIKGFHGIFIPIIIFVALFYIAFILVSIFSEAPGNIEWIFIIFVPFHAAIMLGIPYFIMRRGVSRMKYELERDFFYMTK